MHGPNMHEKKKKNGRASCFRVTNRKKELEKSCNNVYSRDLVCIGFFYIFLARDENRWKIGGYENEYQSCDVDGQPKTK